MSEESSASKVLRRLQDRGYCIEINPDGLILLILARAGGKLSVVKLLACLYDLSRFLNIEFELPIVGSKRVLYELRRLVDRGLVEHCGENELRLTSRGWNEVKQLEQRIRSVKYVCSQPNIAVSLENLHIEISNCLSRYSGLSDREVYWKCLETRLCEIYYFDPPVLDLALKIVRYLAKT